MTSIVAAWIVTGGLMMAHPGTNKDGIIVLFFLMLGLTAFGFYYAQ